MKFQLLLCTFLFFCISAKGQYTSGKRLEIVSKGGATILLVTERYFSDDNREVARFVLNSEAKKELIDALRKGISWGSINSSKQLSFDKRIAGIRSMNIIFNGRNDGGHSIVLYTTYPNFQRSLLESDEFDIEKPGTLFWQFMDDEQVRLIIASLEKQNDNLDDIFK